jgi:hypothetical protein
VCLEGTYITNKDGSVGGELGEQQVRLELREILAKNLGIVDFFRDVGLYAFLKLGHNIRPNGAAEVVREDLNAKIQVLDFSVKLELKPPGKFQIWLANRLVGVDNVD